MGRKLSKIYTPYNIFTVILLLIIYVAQSYSQNLTPSEQKTISSSKQNPLKIIDGDSLEIGKARIRLQGIDAPEYIQTCKNENNKSYHCGIDSTNFLKHLTNDKTIICTIHDTDKYKRYLCTCYANNLNINSELVKNGYAITYLDDTYKKEESIAKRNKSGIWDGDFIHPRLFRKLQEH